MIKLENLTKKYKDHTVFKNVDFTFPNHGLVCVLGASGCGKSSLLNLIAGFDSNYNGSIHVLGSNLNKMTKDQLCHYRRNNIGFIFQNYNLISGYTVKENILLSCQSTEENLVKLHELLKRFDLDSKTDEKVKNLSGGQKQRVAIIRALMDDPTIILADEPTGALDRKNSTEIMQFLKDLSKDRLVLVITHDKKICEFADEIVTIKDNQLIGNINHSSYVEHHKMILDKHFQKSAFKHGAKNFKVHLTSYIAIALAISVGIFAFILSLSSENMLEKSIADFKDKNTAFNNGYIKLENNGEQIKTLLQDDKRIENVYNQYIIENISLTEDNKTVNLSEKYPMPKATEKMSYGVMPRAGKNEISLSPSLAKKFNLSIDKLIGKTLVITYNNKEYSLKISGIYNANYDDFFVSSDIEKEFYIGLSNKDIYAISYDVTNFKDIVDVANDLLQHNIEAKSAAKEVETLQNTFQNLSRLFFIVSILILAIGCFISIILLVKLQNTRYRELGLLSALGYSKRRIRTMIIFENFLLSLLAAILNIFCISTAILLSSLFHIGLIIMAKQFIISIFSTGFAIILFSTIASHKLLNTEPAVALKK